MGRHGGRPSKKIFLALVGGSLLAIPPPQDYAGKTAAESGRKRTAIVTLWDGAANATGTGSALGIWGFDGKGAARRR